LQNDCTAHGFPEAVQLLLEHGATVDGLSDTNVAGLQYTAFHGACSEGHPDCVEMLVRAGCDTTLEANDQSLADPEKRIQTGEQLAAQHGYTQVLERLELLKAEGLIGLPVAAAKRRRRKRKKKTKSAAAVAAGTQRADNGKTPVEGLADGSGPRGAFTRA
jgi:ankyrin repeat protein